MNPSFGIAKKPVGFFWDIENCPVPKQKLASGIVHHLRNFFVIGRLNSSEFEFLVACDITKMKQGQDKDLDRAGGVTLAHVPGSSKNAADEKLREQMRKFVDTHGNSSPTIILISGDIDFVNDLRAYQTRSGCHIVLIHGNMCSPQFKQGWNEMYAFQDFCNAVPNIVAPTPGGGGGPSNGNEAVSSGKSQGQPPSQGQNRKAPGLQQSQLHGPTGKKAENGPTGKKAENGPTGKKVENGPTGKKAENGPGKAQFNPNQQHKGLGRGGGGPPSHQQQVGYGHGGNVQKTAPPPKPMPQQQQQQPSKEGQKKDKDQKKDSIILMVSGLPGKMDYKILKDHLQEEASTVAGKVCYVNNGQGFIAFRKEQDAMRAIELFHGKEVYGKKLIVQLAQGWVSPLDKQKKEQQQQQNQQNPLKQTGGGGGGQQRDPPGFVMISKTSNPGAQASSPLAAQLGTFAGAIAAELARTNLADDGKKGKQPRNKPPKDANCSIQ